MRTCKKCGISEKETCFVKIYNKKYGKYYTRNVCVKCDKARKIKYSRKYYKNNKKKQIDYVLRRRDLLFGFDRNWSEQEMIDACHESFDNNVHDFLYFMHGDHYIYYNVK